MRKILTLLGAVLFCVSVLFAGWSNVCFTNKVDCFNQKIDGATSCETRKEVEESCRAMISSYEADKRTWEQYKDSDNSEQRSWADQAKIRANQTAANYNNYILKNSYVWSGNVPDDILSELAPIEDPN